MSEKAYTESDELFWARFAVIVLISPGLGGGPTLKGISEAGLWPNTRAVTFSGHKYKIVFLE